MAIRLGFIGTGRITSALVEGFCTARNLGLSILVSPRNLQKALRLKEAFHQVRVASDNQEVVDHSDLVFIAVLPEMVALILNELQFNPNQTVISVAAKSNIAKVAELVHPVARVIRACPLPTVAAHLGPILIYPNDPQIRELFQEIGTPVPTSNEIELDLMWAVTALIAPFYELMNEISAWAADNGVDRKVSVRYTISMFHSLAALALKTPAQNLSLMVKEATTPGGLNEQALGEFRRNRIYEILRSTLDSIRAHQTGSASPLGDQNRKPSASGPRKGHSERVTPQS